jgi:hypothetical protein
VSPEVIPQTPSARRLLSQVRVVTEHEHVRILAGNIETLAKELQDIAELALQDGRTISNTSDSAFDIELQDIEHRLTTLVEQRAHALGLVARD